MDSLNVLSSKCSAEPEKAAAAAPLDLEQVRERLRDQKGPEFWRSLDELAATPAFQELLHREFPRQASEWVDDGADGSGVSRRNFLKLASASLAMAGMTACTRQPVEKIIPYVDQPEQVIPGRPLFFATTVTLGGYGLGVLAESHEGRPTKIEGNPDHPASLGSTDLFAQASVLSLYDPERSQRILKNGRIDKWGSFIAEVGAKAKALESLGGEGIRIVTGDVTSPTLLGLLDAFLTRFPKARWQRWEPAGGHHAAAASEAAFGAPYSTHFDLAKAKVVVAIESDFLTSGPGSVRYARQFADGRRVRKGKTVMSRLYAVESTPTSTATLADNRLQLPPAQVEAFAVALAERLGVAGAALPGDLAVDPRLAHWADEVAKDLRAAGTGQSLVVVGEGASPSAHVLGHAINAALGNVGQTVVYTEPIARPEPGGQAAALARLVAEINAGQVELLIFLGTNPAYSAPADLGFAEAIDPKNKKVATIVHHGLFEDETSQYCHWHVPATHELESWGDARSFDGTVSLIQPLIEPLHEAAKTPLEILGVLLGKLDATPYDFVHDQWKTLPDGEAGFRKALHDGLIAGTALPPAAVPAPAAGAIPAAATQIAAAARRDGAPGALTLLLRPDPTIHDGRFANHPWLQELPKPITKLTWDNALVLSPKTAGRLKLKTEDPVEVSYKDPATGSVRKLETAVWILPGQADGTALLTLGYGRTRAGERGTGHGFDANRLRTTANLWSIPGVSIRGLGGRYIFACTQNHHVLENGDDELPIAMKEAEKRELIRVGTLADFAKNPEIFHERAEKVEDLSFYPQWDYSKGHAWGMSIDLSSCTGCSACVVACQAENNVPAVGKEMVLRGREMHWIRIDRYFQGDLDDPTIHSQPVPCMQCEKAPCEVVCPVAATVHSEEGLNDMVYNRCVGTRYCSNNCPYKVRRFNFFRFSERTNPLIALAQNPDVTVRMRGVMEKCTYCVQRIEEAKIDSKVTGKPIEEQRLKTACQQACPTQAIVFGDLSQDQEVTRLKAEPTNYSLLEELNTRPRTTYLAKVQNPNPALGAKPADSERNENGHA